MGIHELMLSDEAIRQHAAAPRPQKSARLPLDGTLTLRPGRRETSAAA